jgi:hypothetical protein
MNYPARIILFSLSIAFSASPMLAQVQYQVELTRAAIQNQRRGLMVRFMGLSSQQDLDFWPAYQEYRIQMSEIGDRLQEVLTNFVEDHANLSDRRALTMLDEFMKIQEEELKLRKKYVKKFKKVIPPKKVVRFFQIDNKMDAMVNYNLAGSIPLIE